MDPATALATLGLQGFLSEDVWGLIASLGAFQQPNNPNDDPNNPNNPNNDPEDFKILAIADLIGNNPELNEIALEVYKSHVLNHVVQARVIEACGQIVCMYTYIVDPTDVEEGIKALMEAYPGIANRIEVAAYAGMLPALYSGHRGKPSLELIHQQAFAGRKPPVICVPSTVPTAMKIVDILQRIMQEHRDGFVCIFSGLGQVGNAVMRILQNDDSSNSTN